MTEVPEHEGQGSILAIAGFRASPYSSAMYTLQGPGAVDAGILWAFRLHYMSGWEGEPSEASASVIDVRPGLIRERQWLLWGSGGIRGLPWQCGVVKNPPAKQEMGV